MKMLIVILSLLFEVACFGGKIIDVVVPLPKKPDIVWERTADTDKMLRLIGRFGLGHACPVNGTVITAAHVINPFFENPYLSDLLLSYNWSDNLGNKGMAVGVRAETGRDLGFMHIASGSAFHYSLAKEEPKPGDKLWWQEYDFSSRDDLLDPVVRDAELIRSVSGHYTLSDYPTSGASGSCLLNDNDEVVGVIAWSLRPFDDTWTAVAVSVVDTWWPTW